MTQKPLYTLLLPTLSPQLAAKLVTTAATGMAARTVTLETRVSARTTRRRCGGRGVGAFIEQVPSLEPGERSAP